MHLSVSIRHAPCLSEEPSAIDHCGERQGQLAAWMLSWKATRAPLDGSASTHEQIDWAGLGRQSDEGTGQ